MMISRMVTKETGSEINERYANNDKVEPAPEHSNMERTIIFKHFKIFLKATSSSKRMFSMGGTS